MLQVILAQIQQLAFSVASSVQHDGIHDLPFTTAHSTIQRYNILRCDHMERCASQFLAGVLILQLHTDDAPGGIKRNRHDIGFCPIIGIVYCKRDFIRRIVSLQQRQIVEVVTAQKNFFRQIEHTVGRCVIPGIIDFLGIIDAQRLENIIVGIKLILHPLPLDGLTCFTVHHLHINGRLIQACPFACAGVGIIVFTGIIVPRAAIAAAATTVAVIRVILIEFFVIVIVIIRFSIVAAAVVRVVMRGIAGAVSIIHIFIVRHPEQIKDQ